MVADIQWFWYMYVYSHTLRTFTYFVIYQDISFHELPDKGRIISNWINQSFIQHVIEYLLMVISSKIIYFINLWWLTRCGLVMQYGNIDLDNIGWHNGLLPGGTKPLFEAMLTCHHPCPVAFKWVLFHKRYRGS